MNKYILYARKSSESDEKQVQSIDDQLDFWTKRAQNLWLNVVKVFTEEKSAKDPNERKVFLEMMQYIKDGNADSIVAWKLDRLTRNPVDTGLIQFMLQKGKIKSIITSDREYLPQDAGLLFSVETGNANQFIMDLSKNTKRGMRGKADRWGLGWPAPHGYLNDVINKTVIPDYDRFDSIRQMWDLMLTGIYSVPDIVDIANNKWGFLTLRKKKKWGCPLNASTLNHIFHNPFYKGMIRFKGDLIQWVHTPMVTPAEFERVQQILSGGTNPDNERSQKHWFAFTGSIHCGCCGCAITAEHKSKHQKNGNKHEYVYYHCTHRKDTKLKKCDQRGNISESALQKQIEELLTSIQIHPDFVTFAKRIIRGKHEVEIGAELSIRNRIDCDINKENAQLARLLPLLLDETISKAEYDNQKTAIKKRIELLQSQKTIQQENTYNWVDTVENTLDFVSRAKERFSTGDVETKKMIFKALGSNLLLKDGKLSLDMHSWFLPFKKINDRQFGWLSRLEPAQKSTSIWNTDALGELNSIWLPG